MDCKQAQNLFDAFLNGELSGSMATEFGAHRLKCERCRRELALLEVAGHVIASDTDTPSLDAEFTDRLLACAVKAQRPWYRQPRTLIRAATPVAAAACLVFAVSYLTGDSRLQPSTATTVVANSRETVETDEELQRNVERALEHNPDDLRLQKLAERTHSMGKEIAESTKDGACLLKTLWKTTMIEVLQSIETEASLANDQPIPAPTDAPEDQNQPLEEL